LAWWDIQNDEGTLESLGWSRTVTRPREGVFQVVFALGPAEEIADQSIRFRLGRTTTRGEIDSIVERLNEILAIAR
jgi:cysteine sulfinate desulfinase/cysteine desulfurase-like protein